MIEQLPDLPIDHTWTLIVSARQQALTLCLVVQVVLCLVFAAWLVSNNARTAAGYERVAAACSVVVGK